MAAPFQFEMPFVGYRTGFKVSGRETERICS